MKVVKEVVNTDTGVIEEQEVQVETPKDLIKLYEDIDLEIAKAEIARDEFIKSHSEIFAKLEELDEKIAQFSKEQASVKDELKAAMREANLPDVDGSKYTAHYTASYTKKNFDTKQFYEDYAPDTAMYKKYVGTTNVSESVSIKEIKKK